jgi:hypothetical protein
MIFMIVCATGYIYQVRPKLLTSHESRTIITRILSSQDTAVRVQLLQVFLALLQHDQRDAAPTEEEGEQLNIYS